MLLCAGAVQSPQILQLSGIGDPDGLRAAGVASTHALKGVGENLQDHLDVILSWETPNVKTAYSHSTGLNRLTTGLELHAAAARASGRQNFLEAGAFLKSRPDLDRPDLQLHCVMAIMKDHGKQPVAKDGFSIHVCQLRPESRGRVGLRSRRSVRRPRPSSPTTWPREEDRRRPARRRQDDPRPGRTGRR